MKLERAKFSDLPEILDLLRASELPLEGVAEILDNFLVLRQGKEIIGCAGLEIHGPLGLLRSVAISQKNRGQGLGTLLTTRVLELARKKKLEKIYLITTTAESFFQKFGFKRVERSKVDPAIHRSAEFSHLCPSSAVVMFMNIARIKES